MSRLPIDQQNARDFAIWGYRQQGRTYQQIGDLMGLDRSTIGKSIKRTTDRLQKEQEANHHEAKLTQIERLDLIFNLAMTEYELSKKPKQQVKTYERKAPLLQGQPVPPQPPGTPAPQVGQMVVIEEERETQVITRDGAVAYLREAREALAQMAELQGVNAPTRVDMTSGGKPIAIPAVFLPEVEDEDTHNAKTR